MPRVKHSRECQGKPEVEACFNPGHFLQSRPIGFQATEGYLEIMESILTITYCFLYRRINSLEREVACPNNLFLYSLHLRGWSPGECKHLSQTVTWGKPLPQAPTQAMSLVHLYVTKTQSWPGLFLVTLCD